MTAITGRGAPRRSIRSRLRSGGDAWMALLTADTRRLPLVLVAGLVLAAGAWVLASPPCMLSRLMTWDLLFNLEGAWRLRSGQVAHVDFHDPLGILAFWPTVLGFRIAGPGVFAFISGIIIVAAIVFAAATVAAARRLPPVPAILFVLFACQLVLVPTNTGSLIDHFTFAMSYNANGWAALSILSLILFLPPRHLPPGREGDAAWPDLLVAGLLVLALYYLKITYFLVAMGEMAIALLVCDHLRAAWRAWAGLLLLLLANALAPYNWSYLADILASIKAGAVRGSPGTLVVLVTANATELALGAALFLVALALWRLGEAPFRLPAAIGVLTGAAAAVLSQNAQLRGLPLCVVAYFLLYEQVRRNATWAARRGMAWALLALLAIPAANIASAALSMASYRQATVHRDNVFMVTSGSLRGLAVPVMQDGAVADFDSDYSWVGHIRQLGGDIRLSQYEYIQTLLEAAALFDGHPDRTGRILLFDQVNPLAFVLGRPPARGVTLWMDTEFPWQPAETMFADVDFVLVPKRSTYAELTEEAVVRYGPYLHAHFPVRLESPHWTLLSRHSRPS